MVVDDHSLFRRGMIALLSDFNIIDNISEASNGKELIDLIEMDRSVADIILLDVNMPVMDGIEATKIIKKDYPEIKIIILSMEDDAQLVGHLVDQGVDGYLLKNADPDELELAIKMVAKNDFYFSSSLSGAVLNSLKSNKKDETEDSTIDLTSREIEVLTLTCEEYTAAEIGEKLSISARTVEGHKRKLLEKTGTKNMAGLVIFAIKNSLVEV